MENLRFYLISEKPAREVYEVISKMGIITHNLKNEKDLQSIEFFDYWEAINVIQELNKISNSNNYIVLNKIGYKEFKELRDERKFKLQDLINKDREEIDLSKLEIKLKEPFGGGVIKGKKSDFQSAFNFWVNSITKIIKDGFEIDSDLDGGTYNPISLKTLNQLVSNSCGQLTSYIDKEKFVSAIEMQNDSGNSGCFFVETEDEYFLIDIHCH